MAWDESRHALGVPAMDDTHREFVELAYALLVASDEDFPAVFVRLHEHTRQHFEHEGKLWRPAGWGQHVNTPATCRRGSPPICPRWIQPWQGV